MESQNYRRAERVSTNIKLQMEPLYDDGTVGESFMADVTNVSKGGLGFQTERDLNDHSFFRAQLVLESKESMDTIIETVRHEKKDEQMIQYGGRFVGLSESDQFKIEVFRLFSEQENL